MRRRAAWALLAICLVVAVVALALHKSRTASAGQMLPGHGIKCLKADGVTPCGDAEITGLNNDLAGFKQLVTAGKNVAGDTKTVVGDGKTLVGDGQQGVSDAKQLGSDGKQLGSDAKNKDPGQAVDDGKTAVTDAKTAAGDGKTAAGDAQQATGDAKQLVKDLQGIGSLSLRSPDGTVNCAQNDGSACSDTQTKALQTHAAQKSPPITVKREADQPGS